jgi:competence protein CoiA
MLCATRKSSGQTVLATSESKSNGPFSCPECGGPVVLRAGSVRVSHFTHRSPTICDFARGESEAHRRCKLEIYEALLREPGVTDVAMERSLQTARPDISARINGVPVAIEVQISALSIETIIRRTEEYARKGIYVLWLPQWTPYLDGVRNSPRLWEKWIHAAYFGRVYYWIEGLTIASYRFEPYFNRVPDASWYSEEGEKMTARAYSRRSKRYRSPARERILNLAKDFIPKDREWWEGADLTVPATKLFMGGKTAETIDQLQP